MVTEEFKAIDHLERWQKPQPVLYFDANEFVRGRISGSNCNQRVRLSIWRVTNKH